MKMVVALLALGLALGGGMQFYQNDPVVIIFGFLGMIVVTSSLVLIWWVEPPPLLWPGLVIMGAMCISTAANTEIAEIAGSQTVLFMIALGVMVVAAHPAIRPAIGSGLYLAGILWPAIWLAATVAGWWDNPNIVAVWSVVAVVMIWQNNNRWWLLLPHYGLLIYLASRGAIIGLLAAGLVMYWELIRRRLNTNRTAIATVGLALAGLLIWVKPATAFYRLHYWQSSLAAVLANPIFGVGPGGIQASQVITEPGGGYQIHAHNLFISSVVEMGLVGVAAWVVVGWWLYTNRATLVIERWQLAIIAGLLAHSLVDLPLYWPGPLFLLALVAGGVTTKS